MPDISDRLRTEIISEIEAGSPIPFARFMDLCLYHPSYGYYPRGIGGGGGRDYLTSSGTHRVFGTLVARQVEEMWRRTGLPGRFMFVEFGPGEGLFAADFLREAQRTERFARALEYILVEPSPVLRRRQRELLVGRASIPLAWAEDHDLERQVGGTEGCLFANEVLDAFPVHRVIRTGRGISEVHVAARDGRLVEILERPSTIEIEKHLRHLHSLGVTLEEGQEIDLNLAAPRWMARAVRLLRRGYLMVIDYGHEARALYSPERRRGTLLAYHRHRVGEDFLSRPGEQDLTAHVDFSTLLAAAEREGARSLGLVTQARFLLALGALDFLRDPRDHEGSLPLQGAAPSRAALREREALLDLILPGRLGERFRVMIVGVGDVPWDLSGLAAPWARLGAAAASSWESGRSAGAGA